MPVSDDERNDTAEEGLDQATLDRWPRPIEILPTAPDAALTARTEREDAQWTTVPHPPSHGDPEPSRTQRPQAPSRNRGPSSRRLPAWS